MNVKNIEQKMSCQTISIVVPVYYNEPNLPDTIPQLLTLGKTLTAYHLELVFVDDGSGDDSLAILLQWRDKLPDQIKVVKLARNFGSMSAILAGFGIAKGDCVGMIAADLQDPPELFLEMIRHWEQGIKAVYAVRSDREESHAQKWFSNTYYSLIRRCAIKNYPAGGFDFFLVDRQVIEDVKQINEKNTNLMTLIFWLGYEHVMIPYVRRSRDKGKSRWTLSKKIKLFIDSFVSFSYVPIRLLSIVGLLFAISAFLYGLFVFYEWSISQIEVKGYTPIIILLAFTSGVQMTMLGVLGEYLWRTLDESRKRPSYVIDTIYQQQD